MAGVLRQGFFPPGEARATKHIPQWICKERATKPGAKRTAALWVAPSLACGFVARRSQPHCGGCSLLAPRHRPNWAQQNTSHLGDTTLAHVRRPAECNSAIRQIENLRYGPNVLDLSCGRCPQGCLTVNHSRFCIVRVESWLILRRP